MGRMERPLLGFSIGTKPRRRYSRLLCFFVYRCDRRGSRKVSRSMRVQMELYGKNDRSLLGSRLAKSQDGDILCFRVSFFCFCIDNATAEDCQRSRVGGGYKRFLELMMRDTLEYARLAEVDACFAFAFAFMLTGWSRDLAQGRMIAQIAKRTLISPLHYEILMYHRLVIACSMVSASCIQSHCRHRRCL
jgi:hypothetical protein